LAHETLDTTQYSVGLGCICWHNLRVS